MRSDVVDDIILAAYFVFLFFAFVFTALPVGYTAYVSTMWAFNRFDFWAAVPITIILWAILLALGKLIFNTIMVLSGMVFVLFMLLLKFIGRLLRLP